MVIVTGILILLHSTLFSQEWSKFNCNGSGKCQGVEFSIKYPSNWKSTGGEHPNIIRNFGIEERRGYIKMVVYLDKFNETPTQSEVNGLFSKDHISSYFKVNKYIEFNNEATIEGEKCIIATVQVEDKMYDQVVRSIVKTNMLIWKNYLFQVNFFIFSNDQSFKTMNEMYSDYNSIFREVMNSLVIISKWKQ